MGRSAVGRVVGRFFDYGLFDFARFPSWYFMPAARTTRARSAQFRLRRELPFTRVVQILPAAQTTRTRHQRGAILYLCGE